jgi:hypothetical protein
MSIFMSILMVLSCKAALQEERGHMLLNAKNPKVFRIKIKAFAEQRRLKSACEFELSENIVPKSCYRLNFSKEKIQVIDKACERASYIMKEEIETNFLSQSCATFIKKKNEDLRYSKEEETPGRYILER